MNNPDSYTVAWRSYRRRRALALTTLIAFAVFVAVGLTNFLSDRSVMDILLFVVISFFAAQTWLILWPCPSCGNPFFWRPWYTNVFARSCLHCGLAKWSNTGPASRGA